MANILERYGIKMIESLIMFLCGVIVGYAVYALISAYKKFKLLRELDITIEEKLSSLKEKIIPSRIEEENGMLFLYNKDTNEFLGQGKTLIELEHSVKDKFPGKLFNVPQEELNKYNKEVI